MIDPAALREAFATIGDEAPKPERVRAIMVAAARRHRQRRLVLRVAGAGGVAATVGLAGAGVYRWAGGSGGEPFPEIVGGPGGGWADVALRYRPTWLPAGYGRTRIAVLVVGEQVPVISLTWQRPEDGGRYTATVGLTVGWHEELNFELPDGPAQTVDINGVPGRITGPYVRWEPAGGPILTVTAFDEDGDEDRQRRIALRVARAIRPDGRHTWVGPRFGWRPADLDLPWLLHTGYEGGAWYQSVSFPRSSGRSLEFSFGPDVHRNMLNRDAAQPVVVRGADAWQVPENHQLFLTLPDGVQAFLQLTNDGAGPTTDDRAVAMADLRRIAEEFDFGPWPDMTWVGTR